MLKIITAEKFSIKKKIHINYKNMFIRILTNKISGLGVSKNANTRRFLVKKPSKLFSKKLEKSLTIS